MSLINQKWQDSRKAKGEKKATEKSTKHFQDQSQLLSVRNVNYRHENNVSQRAQVTDPYF
jgi:hypothetical protein